MVHDAVVNGTDDLVLAKLIEITIRAINDKRDLFPDMLNAPIFYERYFRPWVQTALDEDNALDKLHQSALELTGIIKPNRE